MPRNLRLISCSLILFVFLALPVQAKSITLTKPKNKASVSLNNSTVTNYWKNYKMYAAAFNTTAQELSTPDPLVFKWKKAAGYKFTFYLSTNKNFKKSVKYVTSSNTVKIRNLLRGTTYYWKVTGINTKARKKKDRNITSPAYKFTTQNSARIMYINKVKNARDLGGYTTESGKKVKQGLLFRSAKPDSISEAGKTIIRDKLKIRTQLDLRASEEIPLKLINSGVYQYIHSQGVSYETIIHDETGRARFAREMKILADRDNYPLLFHCVAGRDRTGTLAFMVNGLLGVPKTELYKDYELTYLSAKSSSDVSARIARFDAFCKEMESYADASKPLSYNIQAYLLDSGVTQEEIDTIKSILLE